MEDIKVDEVINKIKDGAVKAKDEAEKITKNVVKKTSNIINKSKINYVINENEGKVKDVMESIGKMVYSQHSKGIEFAGDIGEKCNQIDTLIDEINSLKEQIAEIENNVICDECGEYNAKGSSFCSSCGTKLSE